MNYLFSGIFNIIQIVGYKFGMLSSSFIQNLFHEESSFRVTLVILASIYCGSVIVCIYILNMKSPLDHDSVQNLSTNELKYSESHQWEDLLNSIIRVKDIRFVLCFCLLYKFGEKGFVSMLSMFLVDKKISVQKVSFMKGFIFQSASIFGSVLGGLIDCDNRFVCHINPFVANVPILYPQKTPENRRFSGVFWRYEAGTLTMRALAL